MSLPVPYTRRHARSALLGAAVRSLLITFLPLSLFAQSTPSSSVWVRSVFVRGNETTEDDVILREMMLTRGSPLSDELLELDRERVYNLQLFNRVDINTHTIGDSADLYVTVDERWYFYPFPVLGIRHRDWNKIVFGLGVAHSNVAGLNQKLFAQVVGGYDRWVELSYANPRFLGTADYYFGLQLSYSHLHPLALDGEEYQQERWVGRMSLGKRFGYHQTLVGTIGVESWQVPVGFASRRTAASDGRDVFGTVTLQYVDDRRYLREYPMSGSYLQLEVSKDGFGESVMNIVRFRGDVRQYVPVWRDWSVALRTYTHVTSGGVVPSYRHVFLGYEERIRGEFTTKREGEAQFGGNVELRIPLIEPRYYEAMFIPVQQFRTLRYGLYGALFAEAGKVWYRNQSPVDVALRAGYGVGLHAVLPYGVIARADIGMSLNGTAQLILDAGASF